MDYDSGPYVIIIAAGVTHASFNISLSDDIIFENDENFMLTINSSSLPSNITVGDPGQVTVTIVDNDGKKSDVHLVIIQVASNFIETLFVAPTVSFGESAYTVDENNGPALLTVVFSNPSSTDITIKVFTIDGSANGNCV